MFSKENNIHDWENPAIFQRNQVKPHTTLMPFVNKEQALTMERKSSPYHQTLNGRWKFDWSETPDQAPGDFHQTDYDIKDWDDIKVPSNWQMEGYGHAMFRNVAHTFSSNPPYVPTDYNPVGSYVRSFKLPEGWEDREIFLHFEGVKSASYVWINGQEVGYNQGGMEPAEYNITEYLQTGENKIAVQVLRYSDGTYLECQDMWRLAGIYRDVYLMAAPKVHIRDFYVTTELDSDYCDATINVKADLVNYLKDAARDYSIQVQLFDQQKKSVLVESLKGDINSLLANEERSLKISEEIKNPKKWSAEYPNLYTLILELINDRGEVVEVLSTRVGFRKIEVKNQAVYINGVPVKFNGVNSHMQHPETGRMVDIQTMKKDLILMKQFNVNCVRTCHYPPNVEYLALADELGLYIVDETGDEAHANEHLSDDPEWKDQYLDRMIKMVYRDRNHPSVVIWSAGNESGWGENICDIISEGKKLDPGRPAWLYGGNDDTDPKTNPIKCEDIVGPRYLKPFELENLFAKVSEEVDPRPSFMDEYLSAAGNSLGGLDEYWDLIYKYPRLTGGAIWDWISPGIKKEVTLTPDKSPNNLKCALMGTAHIVADDSDKVLSLSGHDDWVEVYRAAGLDISGDKLTISVNVSPKKSDVYSPFVTKGDHQYGIVQTIDNNIEFYIYTNQRYSVKAKLPDNWQGNWYHLAGIYDGKEMRLYIDGQLEGVKDCKGKILDSPFPVNIGRNAEIQGQDYEGNLCNALINSVSIFDKVISIDKLYEASIELQSSTQLWLDFDESSVDGEFYSLGIGARSYGLVLPDRTIKPELWQLKKSAQAVAIEAVDLDSGKVRVFNRHHFKNLKELNTIWKLTADGEILQNGEMELELAPLEKSFINIPYQKFEMKQGVDYQLDIAFCLASDTNWADKGHQVAWEQFDLSPKRSENKSTVEKEKTNNLNSEELIYEDLSVEEIDNKLIISGSKFRYTFIKEEGLLDSLSVDGKEVIEQGPIFNAWRPPLANELDSWPIGRTSIGQTKEGIGNDIANGWRSIGLNRLKHELESFSIIHKNKEKVEISAVFSVSANNYTTGFDVTYYYQILASGELIITVKTVPQGRMTHWLPKIGLQMQIPKQFEKLKWYGRGPYENYPDRKSGAKIGLYENTVDNEYIPYLIPQDYGNKTDVNWFTLTNNNNLGLKVTGESFNFSAHIFSPDNLTRANHTFQLKEADYITVNMDHRVSGVGGTSISVLNKYRVLPDIYQYTLRINPLYS